MCLWCIHASSITSFSSIPQYTTRTQYNYNGALISLLSYKGVTGDISVLQGNMERIPMRIFSDAYVTEEYFLGNTIGGALYQPLIEEGTNVYDVLAVLTNEKTVSEKEEYVSPTEQYANVPIVHEPALKAPARVKVYRSTTALPFFYEKMGLDDDTAPLPFSVTLFGNYMQTKVITSNFQGASIVQDVNVKILGMNIPFGDFKMPLTGFAQVKEVEQRFTTGGMRFAVNILPFWSVYGLLAQSTGYTKSAVDVKNIYMRDVNLKVNTGKPWQDALVNAAIQAMGNTLLVKEGSMPFVMDFDSFSTGIGTSLAIGGKLFFTAVDANYVITTVESANIIVHTINASARIGMHKQSGSQVMAMWIGANYMENIAGSDKLGAVMSIERLSDIFQLEGIAQSLVGNKPANIRWSVDQRPLNVFSAIVGMRYSPRKNFDIVTEVGFIDRVSIMVSAGYNF